MTLLYQKNGSLIPGIYEITWDQLLKEFGFNQHRLNLIQGLYLAITHLKAMGCTSLFIDGSFTTKKTNPIDYDACWDPEEADPQKLKTLHPVFIDFENHRVNQKNIYRGEFLPLEFLDFFQEDRDGIKKGIIKLNLNSF